MGSFSGSKSSSRLCAALSRGSLEVEVTRASCPPEVLFGFAERHNPKRAFLFVSRVLGRHVPVRPSIMHASYQALAARLPADLPGPVLVIGMAETATGLGAGVHRAYSAKRSDALYLATTRHSLGSAPFVRFEEEHSHASSHWLHSPVDPLSLALFERARSLVLVDDEASTGKTFINLIEALGKARAKAFDRIVTCVLTDWSQGEVRRCVEHCTEQVSLLEGRYRFDESPGARPPGVPGVPSPAKSGVAVDSARDWGRLGTRHQPDVLAPLIEVRPGERILVLGTGEYVWRPYLLAERLERQGADVHFGATTRSPIAMGHAIEHVLRFPDNYGQGVPNFLYNVCPGQFDRILLCVETPGESVPKSLIEALGAEVILDAL